MRIVLADDHPLVLAGIRATLAGREGIQVVAQAVDGDQALQAVLEHRPDLLVLDLSMPGLPTHRVISEAREAIPGLKVLVLTAYDDDVHVGGLSHLAISGYLLKDEAAEHLTQAIRVIREGAVWFSQSVADRVRGLPRRDPEEALSDLSSRDREVLIRIGRGLDNKLIARELDLAEQTVRNYVSTLYQKIGVDSRAEAVVWVRDRLAARERE